jgi:NADP-dependent 3-hydroxy acid dehydrogenase YdfG
MDHLARPKNRMDDLVALVTGASRGLGEEAAVALSEAGAEVVLLSRTREELERVANRIRVLGGVARILVFDVTDVAAVH